MLGGNASLFESFVYCAVCCFAQKLCCCSAIYFFAITSKHSVYDTKCIFAVFRSKQIELKYQSI